MGSNFFGASDGNRTHAASLEGWNSTIELHSQILATSTLILYHNSLLLSIAKMKKIDLFFKKFFAKLTIRYGAFTNMVYNDVTI